MKTAIVIEINADAATVMKTGGEFETITAQSGWQKGDVITIAEKRRGYKALYAAVACLAIVLLCSFGGYRIYFTETFLVSLDINPSIEISINRFDRVIDTAFYNEDGEGLLSAVDLKGMRYDDALETLLQSSALRPYLEANDYLDITVSGDERLTGQIQTQTQALTSSFNLQISCHGANAEVVSKAHANGMTAGRYLAFLELQELDPEVNIDDYSSCGIGQIQEEIEAHHQNRHGQQEGHGGQGSSHDSSIGPADEVIPPSGNSTQEGGYGDGKGNGPANTAAPEDAIESGEYYQGHSSTHGHGQGGNHGRSGN